MAHRTRQDSPKLTELTFLILVALAGAGQEGSHGYGMIKTIKEITEGRKLYAIPSLYDGLRALEGWGLVELASEQVVNSRLRRYYRITPRGGHAARDYQMEQERFQQRVRAATGGLRLAEGG